MRGQNGKAKVREAMQQLERWLGEQGEYVAAAPPLVMGYNSPFIPRHKRF